MADLYEKIIEVGGSVSAREAELHQAVFRSTGRGSWTVFSEPDPCKARRDYRPC